MMFVFKQWERFCKSLSDQQLFSVPACEIKKDNYLVLKHDVETNVKNAYLMAKIESKYGHKGSYYVQAYLMDDSKNIKMLLEMKEMGHEISYHYDVMDSSKGNLEEAIKEFEQNRKLFLEKGFDLKTVCQHGNPIVNRTGYTSNRDFFRSEKVKTLYPSISDIMVNYKSQYDTEYLYFSDAGRKFKHIYDPINNDLQNSEYKNKTYKSLRELQENLSVEVGNIISIHPHRWSKSTTEYVFKSITFKFVRFVAKTFAKIPFFRKIMSKYYYLAKKI